MSVSVYPVLMVIGHLPACVAGDDRESAGQLPFRPVDRAHNHVMRTSLAPRPVISYHGCTFENSSVATVQYSTLLDL